MKSDRISKRRIIDYAYTRDVFLVQGSDRAIARFLAGFGVDGKWTPTHWGMYMKMESGDHYVIVSTRGGSKMTDWRRGALAHEVIHLAWDVFKEVGIKLSDDSEEAFTYYFQGIYSKMLRFI